MSFKKFLNRLVKHNDLADSPADSLVMKIIKDGVEVSTTDMSSGKSVLSPVSSFNLDVPLQGNLSVLIQNHKTGKEELVNLGKNVITTRAGLVMSRLCAQVMKEYAAGFIAHPFWLPYADFGYTSPLSGNPGSFAYPFSATPTGGVAHKAGQVGVIQNMIVFGGVGTNADSLTSSGAIATQSCWSAHASAPGDYSDLALFPYATDERNIYVCGLTGMNFGNGGHYIADFTLDSGINADQSNFCLLGTTLNDDTTLPAQPKALPR